MLRFVPSFRRSVPFNTRIKQEANDAPPHDLVFYMIVYSILFRNYFGSDTSTATLLFRLPSNIPVFRNFSTRKL